MGLFILNVVLSINEHTNYLSSNLEVVNIEQTITDDKRETKCLSKQNNPKSINRFCVKSLSLNERKINCNLSIL